ncbi:MAG: hypothetical protein Sylvanvirus7_9 [Sylvanvirus sp.]|uniref:Uncharacterized protein n=1 Tax=Sylvanvirus sp. TaxID=2487774 RepID=A0A3G5AJM9_9VIRU|nr:MAG: hypothetical protein Sylvanvirus7_9 [Sylvanvirus sp.]
MSLHSKPKRRSSRTSERITPITSIDVVSEPYSQLKRVIDVSLGETTTVDKTKSLLNDLSQLQQYVSNRLLTTSTLLEDQIVMVSCSETPFQDMSVHVQTREVHASFQIGPHKHPFTIDIEHTDVEGEKPVLTLKTDLFDWDCSDDETRPIDMNHIDVVQFYEDCGLNPEHFVDEEIETYSQEDLRFLWDIMEQCFEKIEEEGGEEDAYGMDLGFTVDKLREAEIRIPAKKQKKSCKRKS